MLKFETTEKALKNMLGSQFLTLQEASSLSKEPNKRKGKYRIYKDITQTQLCQYNDNGTGINPIFTAQSASQSARFHEVIAFVEGLTY